MDKVLIKNMVFMGCHGCEDYEKEHAQPFNIDLEIKLDLNDSMENDCIKSTVDYSAIYKLVEAIVGGESFNLIEKLASSIIYEIQKQYPVKGVRVVVRKPKAPINGKLDYVGVEIERFFNE